MSPALRIVVYPPDAEGGRRVRVDGEILGRALGPGGLLEFLRRAGLDPDDVRLDDELLIEWRGGGPGDVEQFKSTLYRANGSRRSSGYAAAQGDEARAEFPGVLRVLDLLPSMTGAVHSGLDRFGVGGLVAGEAGAGCLHPQPAAAHRIAGEVGEVGPDLQPVDGLRRLRTLGVQSPSLPPRGE